MVEGKETIHAKFEIKKIRKHYEDTGYTIAEAKFTEYSASNAPTSELIVVGNFVSIFEGDEFEAEGRWVNHNVFGYQFKVELPKRIVPQTQKGIEMFIRKYVKGIGKKTAQKIVDYFGEEALKRIEEDHRSLLQVGGISEVRAKAIQDKLFRHKRFEDVGTFVLSNGGNHKVALRIYEEFGEASIMKIQENPYILCAIDKVGFIVADKFSRNLSGSHRNQERIKESIIYFLNWCSKSRGDLYVSGDEIRTRLSDFLLKVGAYEGEKYRLEENDIEHALLELKSQDRIVIETNEKSVQCVYLNNNHFVESKIVSLLKNLVEKSKPPLCTALDIDRFIKHYEATYDFKFAEKQKSAIHMALLNGISILTGGPGTGKTQTINSIIQCLKYVKPGAVIHLFAPTGKASKRMSELTGMEAMTIHRGIGLGHDEESDREIIVEGDLLVIDEISMMDAYVCYRLLSSIHENTRVLFVGDYEQLPSVGPGLILRDLINSGKIPTTRLTEIFRQAQNSQIVMNSHRIINGEIDSITFDESKGDFFFIERSNRIQAQQTIIQCVKRFVTNHHYKLDDIQILTPMRKGDLGVWSLNCLMQKTFNPPSHDKVEIKLDELNFLREGDRVIHTVNNKDLEVFNGEVGRIVKIWEDADDGLQVEIEYDEKSVVYDKLSIEEVELAYVTTIHKSQGSEYPVVIMPIHSSQENMLTKNLIYTGWTRAKQKVVNIGMKSSLKVAALNADNDRNSQIEEKVRKEINLVA
ncbi:exodeoxyribonuclease V alpha subunit [Paenibacillus sp. 1182]|uniref:SF1B family DNA helicase RecD2 n=1 Tax=Paenibacillus sp. 1182 TaxID=2806565 RepID=UPI001AE605CD|nr:ATP-dependent RecD-like DNA helicase [Paenibacillus sp. 1182]MBP1308749.1 exodeoxyribonuclease V alpha subunit [Paenibacillus sp. 1182]